MTTFICIKSKLEEINPTYSRRSFWISGFGVGLASSSSFVSLNHYFTKKRGQAVGLSMAGTGFGLLVMPQLVRLLLDAYGFRWTVMILGALAFHAVLGSCLLQPVKRHLIEVPVDCEMLPVKVSALSIYLSLSKTHFFLISRNSVLFLFPYYWLWSLVLYLVFKSSWALIVYENLHSHPFQ